MMKKLIPLAFVALGPACCNGIEEQERSPRSEGPCVEARSDGGLVAFTSALSHPRVLAGEAQEEYLHLVLRAKEVPDVERSPLNLALVIDRSGSMASENKLRHAKCAAEQLIARLLPEDRLALVSYDDTIRTDVPSGSVGDPGHVLAAIRALVPGNNTDLCGGLLAGFEQVRANVDGCRLSAVILLSDGLANRGVTAHDAIAAHARTCLASGVRISTMGMGLEYDEDLLTGIALEGAGNYYYVDRAESVGRHLDQELLELTRVVARDIEVRVELAEGVVLKELFGHACHQEDRVLVIPVRDLYGGQKRKIVMRLETSGTAGERRPLAQATLRYRDVATREAHVTEGPPLPVTFTDDAAEVERARDRTVLAQAEVVRNAAALDAAMKLQRGGRFEEAQTLLRNRFANSMTLNDVELRDPDVARILQRMRQVLLDMERTRDDPRASRDLQLLSGLAAMGYAGD